MTSWYACTGICTREMSGPVILCRCALTHHCLVLLQLQQSSHKVNITIIIYDAQYAVQLQWTHAVKRLSPLNSLLASQHTRLPACHVMFGPALVKCNMQLNYMHNQHRTYLQRWIRASPAADYACPYSLKHLDPSWAPPRWPPDTPEARAAM